MKIQCWKISHTSIVGICIRSHFIQSSGKYQWASPAILLTCSQTSVEKKDMAIALTPSFIFRAIFTRLSDCTSPHQRAALLIELQVSESTVRSIRKGTHSHISPHTNNVPICTCPMSIKTLNGIHTSKLYYRYKSIGRGAMPTMAPMRLRPLSTGTITDQGIQLWNPLLHLC